ncbi:MAG: Chloroplast import component protein (Tic20) [Parcubacteria group bacterium ADurb.Bin326]|nr:MAG: Chloroplast import component protein (Tic20) [Parcubacteria group bacterium ADurb.Bin326]
MSEHKTISQDDKLWAALSYLWIVSLIVLSARKGNEYVRYHADQGALLFALSFIGLIPVIGWIVSIFVLVLMVLGLVKSLQGEKWPLPLLSDSAKSFGEWLVTTLKL